MSDFNSYKGHVSREHTAWCGGCVLWERAAVRTATAMSRILRKAGWKKTKAHGWLCPTCAKKDHD